MKQKKATSLIVLTILLVAGVAAAQDFFTVGQDDGRWWLFDPDGERFFSTGVNVVTESGFYCPDLGYSPYYENIIDIYGSVEAWTDATIERLANWNFNTIGGWGAYGRFGEQMPYTVVMGMSGANWQTGKVPDYWGEDFYQRVEDQAQTCLSRADDPKLIGYFIDNEMRWGPDWRSLADLFADYMSFGADSPGKLELISWLRERYQDDLTLFNFVYNQELRGWWELEKPRQVSPFPLNERQADDREAWTAYVADHFFAVTCGAIRAADPNHLILGSRLVSWLTPTVVLEAAANYVDVITVNHYLVWEPFQWLAFSLYDAFRMVSPENMLENYHLISGLPVLITEFSMRGLDAVPPSTWPPPILFKTAPNQTVRAHWVADYTHQCTHTDYIVGYHWFSYMDEPELGRFDGEDSNFGLVTELDEPYELLIDAFTEINVEVYDWPFVR